MLTKWNYKKIWLIPSLSAFALIQGSTQSAGLVPTSIGLHPSNIPGLGGDVDNMNPRGIDRIWPNINRNENVDKMLTLNCTVKILPRIERNNIIKYEHLVL